MRRFSRFDLLHIPAAELSAAFRKRLASHRAALGALRLPAAFDDATGHLVRGWDEASAQSSDTSSVAPGKGNGHSHDLLRTSFPSS